MCIKIFIMLCIIKMYNVHEKYRHVLKMDYKNLRKPMKIEERHKIARKTRKI